VITVKLTTNSPKEPILRQTPGGHGVWGNSQFIVNRNIEECDFWVVYDGLLDKEKTRCPRKHTVFITGEPPTFRKYDPAFLRQFATIITCHRNLEHKGAMYTQQGLNWAVGRRVVLNAEQYPFTLDYDALKSMTRFEKDRSLSVISSDKAFSEGHRKRIAFVRELRRHFGTKIDVFGRGLNEVQDKWDAIARYKYHIVLENSSYPDYWTEKLSDAYLAGAYPFYYGCPNILDYFPKGSLTSIDINQPHAALSKIEETIQKNQYEKSINEIMLARNLVLDEYNLFAFLAKYCENVKIPNHKERISLQPEGTLPPWRRIVRRIIRNWTETVERGPSS